MKILFTGGGSGGHFYPIIAIAEEVRRIAKEERLIPPQLFYMAPDAYDERLLFENEVVFIKMPTGKLRRYPSRRNITDTFKTAWAILKACAILFRVFPDVVVGKGGYGSFPALLSARLFNIPVIIHESDTVPGRVNRWAGKFARRIAVSWPEAAQFFPPEKTAHTGNPIRRALLQPRDALPERLRNTADKPLLFVIGGSLGATALNEAVFKILRELVERYEVIHQTGAGNIADMTARARVILQEHPDKTAYHPVAYLETEELAAVGQHANLIISRAGSTIFEIAAWGTPAILIPIAESNGDHQRENAYAYMRAGAALVIEEENLTPAILLSEIEKLIENEERYDALSSAAKRFAKTDAAATIAREILTMALRHES